MLFFTLYESEEIARKKPIGVKKLAPSLTAAAISEDGLTEAVYMENKRFIAAVQWHPELNYLSDENSVKLIRAFVGSI